MSLNSKIPSHYYNIIVRQIITEKSQKIEDKYHFLVDKKATKTDIKSAVEGLFGVKVKSVNTIIRKGKNRVFRGRTARLSDSKRAIVTLESGNTIDLSAGA